MKYEGKLYGKVGRRLIPLLLTAQDVDKLEADRYDLLEALKAQESAESWIAENDPNDPFFAETVRLKLNHAADLRRAALKKAKGETP